MKIQITVEGKRGTPGIANVIENELKKVKLSKVNTAQLQSVFKEVDKLNNALEQVLTKMTTQITQVIDALNTMGNTVKITSAIFTEFADNAVSQFKKIDSAIKDTTSKATTFAKKMGEMTGKKITLNLMLRASKELPFSEKLIQIEKEFNNLLTRLQESARSRGIIAGMKIDTKQVEAFYKDYFMKQQPQDALAGWGNFFGSDKIGREINKIIKDFDRFFSFIQKGGQLTINQLERFNKVLKDLGEIPLGRKVNAEDLTLGEIKGIINMKREYESLIVKMKQLRAEGVVSGELVGKSLDAYDAKLNKLIASYKELDAVMALTRDVANIGFAKTYETVVPLIELINKLTISTNNFDMALSKVGIAFWKVTESGQTFMTDATKQMEVATQAAREYQAQLVLMASAYAQFVRYGELKTVAPMEFNPAHYRELEMNFKRISEQVLQTKAAIGAGLIDEKALNVVSSYMKDLESKTVSLRGSFEGTIRVADILIQQLTNLGTKGSAELNKLAGGFEALSAEGKLNLFVKLQDHLNNIFNSMEKLGMAAPEDLSKMQNAVARLNKEVESLSSSTNKTAKEFEMMSVKAKMAAGKSAAGIAPYFDKGLPPALKSLAEASNMAGKGMSELGKRASTVMEELQVLKSMVEINTKNNGSFISSVQEASISIDMYGRVIGKLDMMMNDLIKVMSAVGNNQRELDIAMKAGVIDANKYAVETQNNTKALIELRTQLKAVSADHAYYNKQLTQSNLLMARSADATKAMARWTVEGFVQMVKSQAAWLMGFTVFFATFDKVIGSFKSVLSLENQLARAMRTMRSDILTTAETMDQLRNIMTDAAIEMGATFEQSGEMLYQLGSAGLTTEQSMAAFSSTMKTVIASEEDMAEYTKLVAGVWMNFGDELSRVGDLEQQFTYINDVLVATVRDHLAEMKELRDGMKYSISMAQELNISFNQLAAMLGVLSDHMIRAGIAGRSLQSVFAQITSQPEKFAKAFDINIDMNKPIQFMDILDQLSGKFANAELSGDQVGRIFDSMGLRGARSFMILIKNMDELRRAMVLNTEEVGGAVDKMFATMMERPEQKLKRFNEAINALLRTGAEPFVVAATGLAVAIVDLVDALRNLDKFLGGNLGQIMKLVAAFAAMRMTLGLVSKGLDILSLQVLKYEKLNYAQYIDLETRAIKNWIVGTTRATIATLSFNKSKQEEARINNEVAKSMLFYDRQIAGSMVPANMPFIGTSQEFMNAANEYVASINMVEEAQRKFVIEQQAVAMATKEAGVALKADTQVMLNYRLASEEMIASQQLIQESMMKTARTARTTEEIFISLSLAMRAMALKQFGTAIYGLAVAFTKLAIKITNIVVTAWLLYDIFRMLVPTMNEQIQKQQENVNAIDESINKYKENIKVIDDISESYRKYIAGLGDYNEMMKDLSNAYLKFQLPIPENANMTSMVSGLEKYKSEIENTNEELMQTKQIEMEILKVKLGDKLSSEMRKMKVGFGEGWLKGGMREILATLTKGVAARPLQYVSLQIEGVNELRKKLEDYKKTTQGVNVNDKTRVGMEKELSKRMVDLQKNTENYVSALRQAEEAGVKLSYADIDMRDAIQGAMKGITANMGEMVDSTVIAREAIKSLFEGKGIDTTKLDKDIEKLSNLGLRSEDLNREKMMAITETWSRLEEAGATDAQKIEIMGKMFKKVYGREIPADIESTKEAVYEFSSALSLLKNLSLTALREMLKDGNMSFTAMEMLIQKSIFNISDMIKNNKFGDALVKEISDSLSSFKDVFDRLQETIETQFQLMDLSIDIRVKSDVLDSLSAVKNDLYEIEVAESNIAGIEFGSKYEKMVNGIEKAKSAVRILDIISKSYKQEVNSTLAAHNNFGKQAVQNTQKIAEAYQGLIDLMKEIDDSLKRNYNTQKELNAEMRNMNVPANVLKGYADIGASLDDIYSANESIKKQRVDQLQLDRQFYDANKKIAEAQTAPEQQAARLELDGLLERQKQLNIERRKANETLIFQTEVIQAGAGALERSKMQVIEQLNYYKQIQSEIDRNNKLINDNKKALESGRLTEAQSMQTLAANLQLNEQNTNKVKEQVQVYDSIIASLKEQMTLNSQLEQISGTQNLAERKRLGNEIAAIEEKKAALLQVQSKLNQDAIATDMQRKEIAQTQVDEMGKIGIEAKAALGQINDEKTSLAIIADLVENKLVPAMVTIANLLGEVAKIINTDMSLKERQKELEKIQTTVDNLNKLMGDNNADNKEVVNKTAEQVDKVTQIDKAQKVVNDNIDKQKSGLADVLDYWDKILNKVTEVQRLTPASTGWGTAGARGIRGGEVQRLAAGGMVRVQVSDGEAYIPPELYAQNKALFQAMNRGVRVFKGAPGIDNIPALLQKSGYVVNRRGVNANRELFMPTNQKYYSGGEVNTSRGYANGGEVNNQGNIENLGSVEMTLNIGNEKVKGKFITDKDVAARLTESIRREKLRKGK